MNQIYVALSSTIIYFLIVFVNDKFIKKNNKKPREYAIDCIYVFISVYLGIMTFENLSSSNLFSTNKATPQAFTDTPGF